MVVLRPAELYHVQIGLAIPEIFTKSCAMTHNIKWDDLQFILAVAERGSLSAAARDLGVNHATVLRRVASFEKVYQVKLFERRATGYVLTPESRHVLASLRGIESSVEELERSIKGLGSPFEGPVRITSTDTFCQLLLMRHICRLQEEHPRIEVDLSSTNNRLDLARLDADITIRPAVELSEDLVGKAVCGLAFKVYGAPSYLQSNRAPEHAAHSWLGISDLLSRSPVGAWQEATISDSIVFRADSFLTLRNAAEAGLGLALLPCFVGDLSDILLPVSQFPVSLNTSVWVATHKDMAGSPRMHSLMNWFAEALLDDAPLLNGQLSRPE